jgi:hypothetical protein
MLLGLLLAAVWGASLAWIHRDARGRLRTRGQLRLAAAAGLVFPVGGLFLYLLLRPPESVLDRRERRLYRRLLEEELARAECRAEGPVATREPVEKQVGLAA